jgi:hypothetical protein
MIVIVALLFFLLVPLTLLVLVPFNFALTGLGNLLTLPVQMVQVAMDKRRRRNHALEHATVNVLEQKYGQRLPMSGFAEQDGFLVQGSASPQIVMAAAREGLQRLQAGETQLAIHPRCGTNIVTGQLLSAVTFFGVLLLLGNLTLFNALLAMILAIAVARTFANPLGMFLQRTLTTSTDVRGVSIDRLDTRMPNTPFALIYAGGGMPLQFRVWTHDVQVETPSGTDGPKRYKAY